MKKLSCILAFFLLVLSSTISSCKKEQGGATQTGPPIPKVDSKADNETLASIKAMGYKDSEIVDIGDMYVVDGDIAFPKNRKPSSKNNNSSTPTTSQWSTANSVGYNVQNIVIQLHSSMAGYEAVLDSAIAIWNGIPNSRLTFSVYDGSIPVTTYFVETYYVTGCSAAELPYNGLPGINIRFRRSGTDLLSFDQQVTTLAHEIGHVIGFRHTDWYGTEAATGTDPSPHGIALYNAMHILGTPTGTDTNSLMNTPSCGSSTISALSPADIIALTFMFPANVPASGTIPIFRYLGGEDHFYTNDYSDLGNGSQWCCGNYIFEGIGFFAFSSQVTSSVPVYRFYNSSVHDHFYTTTYGSYGGYTYEGIEFYAYTSQINGSVPVYKYYASGSGDHFYTKNPSEFVHGSGGYAYEGIAFYAY